MQSDHLSSKANAKIDSRKVTVCRWYTPSGGEWNYPSGVGDVPFVIKSTGPLARNAIPELFVPCPATLEDKTRAALGRVFD